MVSESKNKTELLQTVSILFLKTGFFLNFCLSGIRTRFSLMGIDNLFSKKGRRK